MKGRSAERYIKKLHQAIWDWVIKNPEKPKTDWPGFEHIPMPDQACFLCEVTDACESCPGNLSVLEEDQNFRLKGEDDGCLQGLFYRYTKAFADEEYSKVTELAEKIRDLSCLITD